MTLGMSQAFHLVNARRRSAITGVEHFSNPYAIAGVGIAVILQVMPAFWPPLGAVLHVSPLSGHEWFVIAAASIAPAVTGQTLRTIRARRSSR
jgi:magnesium-transporting ATPase (P-type)